MNHIVDLPMNQIEGWIDESVNQRSVNQWISQSIDQAVNETIN